MHYKHKNFLNINSNLDWYSVQNDQHLGILVASEVSISNCIRITSCSNKLPLSDLSNLLIWHLTFINHKQISTLELASDFNIPLEMHNKFLLDVFRGITLGIIRDKLLKNLGGNEMFVKNSEKILLIGLFLEVDM